MTAAPADEEERLRAIRHRHDTHDDPETCDAECLELPDVMDAWTAENDAAALPAPADEEERRCEHGFIGEPCEWHRHLWASAPPASPDPPVMPCAVLVDGPLGEGVLIPGATYRVVEVREHWEPTGVEGESPHISTVIRFDPAASAPPASPDPGLLREALAEAIEYVATAPHLNDRTRLLRKWRAAISAPSAETLGLREARGGRVK